MTKVRSSLSRDVTDLIPEVYHRPLEQSSVKCIIEWKIKDGDRHEERQTAYDSVRNSLLAFEPDVFVNNYDITKRFVMNLNYRHRRGNSIDYLGRLALEYAESLPYSNVCHTCYQPIKTKSATVANLRDDSTESSRRAWNNLREKRNRRGIDGKTFVGQHYKSTTAKTDTYADILPYYRIDVRKYDKHGKPEKYGFYLVSAYKGKLVQLTVEPLGDGFRYFLDGVELTDYKRPESIRVFNQKCECRTMCRKCGAKHSIHKSHKCK